MQVFFDWLRSNQETTAMAGAAVIVTAFVSYLIVDDRPNAVVLCHAAERNWQEFTGGGEPYRTWAKKTWAGWSDNVSLHKFSERDFEVAYHWLSMQPFDKAYEITTDCLISGSTAYDMMTGTVESPYLTGSK